MVPQNGAVQCIRRHPWPSADDTFYHSYHGHGIPHVEEQEFIKIRDCVKAVLAEYLDRDQTFDRERFPMTRQLPGLDSPQNDLYTERPRMQRLALKLPLPPGMSRDHAESPQDLAGTSQGSVDVPQGLWVHLHSNNEKAMIVSHTERPCSTVTDMCFKDALRQIKPKDLFQSSFMESLGTVIQARSKTAHSRHMLPKFEIDCKTEHRSRLSAIHISVRCECCLVHKRISLTLTIATISPLGHH